MGRYDRFLSSKFEYSENPICSFFLSCYTARVPISFMNLFYRIHYKSEQHKSKFLIYSLLSLKEYWTSMKYHVYIYHYTTDFKEKAEIFNNFFAKQCPIVKNTRQRPTDSPKRTNNCLSTSSFIKYDIVEIVKHVDPNKALGYEMISLRMLEISGKSILKTFELIFKSRLQSGNFSSGNLPSRKKLMMYWFKKKRNNWKKTNVLTSDFVAAYLRQDTRKTNL